MVDPPASNSSSSALSARDLSLAQQEPAQNDTVPALSNPTVEDGTRTWWIFALVIMILVTVLLLVFCLNQKFLQRMSSRCNQAFVDRLEWLESYVSPKATYYFKRLMITGAILLFVASWVVVVLHLYKQQRWSAISEFLAACKMQNVKFYSFEHDIHILSKYLTSIRTTIFHSAMTVRNTLGKS
jgi:hypothetical protein